MPQLGDHEFAAAMQRLAAGSGGAIYPGIDLRMVTDGMSEGFALLGADFTILEINAETARLDGRDRDSLIGRSHWEAFPGTESSELGVLYKTAMRERRPVALVHRYQWEDGRAAWLDMRAYPVAGGRLALFFRDVTGQQEALVALRNSEQRFRGAIDAFVDALWTNDGDGKMTGEQPGWAALTGQSFQDYQGHGWSQAIHPDDVERTIAGWQQAVAERRPFAIEHRVRVKCGEWRRFAVRAVPLFNDDGTIREWIGVHRDNSQSSLARLQLDGLYAEAPLGLGLIDRDMRFLRLNAALAAMNGFPPEAHIGQTVWDLVPELRDSAEPMLRRVLDTGKSERDVMIKGRTAAAPLVDREWREQFYPFRDESGDVIGVGVIVEDVTEQQAAIRELAAREDEQRRLLDQLFAFVGILTPDGLVTYANRPPLEAAGLALADVVGKPFEDAPWWSYDPAVQQQLREAIAAAARGEVVRYDVPVQLGERRATIDFQLAPLRDRHGTITGLIPSGIVVEERVQAEAALRRITNDLELEVQRRTAALETANAALTAEIERREAAQEALLQSQKLEAMGRLVAGVAHDFNNILAAVLSGLALVGKKVSDPIGKKMIAMSESAAQRGAGLINQMLAFARQQPLSPEMVDIDRILAETEPLIAIMLPANIALSVHSDDACWPVCVDPAQLQSALLNLAINARDAMADHGGRLAVTARNQRMDDQGIAADFVAISVEDTGTGMSPAVLARIAEPFFTTKAVGKGTGLGVAMVHGFVTQSGGLFQATSREGEGTTITILLPRAEYKAETIASTQTATRAATVLIVDDDHDFRAMTAAMLADQGHHVIAAPAAASALALLDTAKCDVVLTDVILPEIDGIELARRITAIRHDVPVIFMAGQVDAQQLAGENILRKPFDQSMLAAAIGQSLSVQTRSAPRSSAECS